jgi:hypothetical protein
MDQGRLARFRLPPGNHVLFLSRNILGTKIFLLSEEFDETSFDYFL